MKNDKLENFKKQYEEIQIPTEKLLATVNNSIQESRNHMKLKKKKTWYKSLTGGAVAAVLVFTLLLNTVEGMAASLSNIPVLGAITKVLTVRSFTASDADKNYNVDIDVPEISGLKNKELEAKLNTKYLEESKTLYEDFMKEIGAANKDDMINKSLVAGYKVITDTPDLLVIEQYKDEIAASAKETVHYQIIDKNAEILLTLPGLFKNDRYIDLISNEIIKQMKQQMKKDDSNIYWIAAETENGEGFSKIDANQLFYINENNKLVIVFNEYDVAPGYMGVVKFEIPTKLLADVLVSGEYIK